MRIVFKVTLCLLILIIGILLGKVVKDWPLFSIDYKLSIMHLASIITTLFVAILISYYFDKEKIENRKEKELIIKRIDDVYLLIESISIKIEDGSISYQEAASKVKRINLTFINVFEVIDSSKLTLQDSDKSEFLDKIKRLKDLLTKTPTISEAQLKDVELPIEVKDGFINYTQSRIAEVETLFELIKGQLLKFQLKINKC